MRPTRLLIALSLLLLAFSNMAAAEKRVALVIGNAAYKNANPLKNPVNDAQDVSAKLKALNFEVISGTNLDNAGMRQTVKKFSEAMVGAEVAVFFYAGHAVQVGGQNFLAPVDTDLKREADLDFETVSLELVKRQMEREAKTNILFLDACRDNPLTRSLAKGSRSASDSKGLARLDAQGEGTFIAYATQPDFVALDGTGRNSPFTSALLQEIDGSGVEISEMMTAVRKRVYEATNNEQLPWTNTSLLGKFFFNPKVEVVKVEEPKESPQAQLLRDQQEAKAVEAEAWLSIRQTEEIGLLESFIENFPDGIYASLAKLTIEKLKLKQVALDKAAKKQDEEKALVTTKEEQIVSLEKPVEPVTQPVIVIPEAKPGVSDIKEIQLELARLGCEPGNPDGKWGQRSRGALQDFSKFAEIKLADLEPSFNILDLLREKTKRICPLACSPREKIEGDVCVTKTCGEGEELSSSGICFTPKAKSAPKSKANTTTKARSKPKAAPRKSTTIVRKKASSPRAPSGKRECFKFNGKLLCN